MKNETDKIIEINFINGKLNETAKIIKPLIQQDLGGIFVPELKVTGNKTACFQKPELYTILL